MIPSEEEIKFLCIEFLAQELRAVTGLEINFLQVAEAHHKCEQRLFERLGPVEGCGDPDEENRLP